MYVIFSGIVIDVNPVSENARSPISRKELGRVIDVSPLHVANIYCGITSTFSPIFMVVTLLHEKNAEYPSLPP